MSKKNNKNNSIERSDLFSSILKIFKFKKEKFVAVLRLQGVIGDGGYGAQNLSLRSLNQKIEEAFSKSTKAVCLVINSPGGSPVQSELIAERIKFLSKQNKIPVYAFVEDVAASGGYWLACAAEKIFVSKNSILGSIGVISSGFGFTEAIKKIGIERRIYSQGKNKSILDSFMPAKSEDIEIIHKIQKSLHINFIDYVKNSRKNKLKESDEFLFNGEFWDGKLAVDFGLADAVDNLYDFVEREFGKKIKIKYIEKQQSWFKRKFLLEYGENIIDYILGKFTQESINSKFRLY
jgi:signal peptide peptidase SppA